MTETVVDLAGLGIQQPVVENEHLFAIDIRRLGFVDDQRAMQSACHLFPGPVVRVIPVGPGIRRHEIVVEGAAWRDGVLRQA